MCSALNVIRTRQSTVEASNEMRASVTVIGTRQIAVPDDIPA